MAAPQGVSQEEPQEEAEPQVQEQQPLDIEPPRTAIDEAPMGFWPKLVDQLRQQLRPPAVSVFVVNENAPVTGVLRGAVLNLEARVAFAVALINKPEVLQVVQECASGILGRPVRVRIVQPGEAPTNNVNFDRLMQFAQEHEDTVDIN